MAGNERWHINQRHCHHLMLPKPALELPQSLRAAITAICIGIWDFSSLPRSKREVMNLPLQQRSWRGIPEPGGFMELSFRAEQGVINLVKTFSNQTISSANVRTKKTAQQIPEHCGRNLQPCAHNIFGNTAPRLHDISHRSNWEENYSVHSVLKCSRGSLCCLMAQGCAGIQHTRVSFRTGTASTAAVVLLNLALTHLLIIGFCFFTEIGS